MTPIDVRLDSIARDAVKMFEGEARAAGIDLQFQLEESCRQIEVEYISLDPTRVMQILIVCVTTTYLKNTQLTAQNLITNAIKFTRLEEKRSICVSQGISLEQPLHNASGHVPFPRTSNAQEAESLRADWERGQTVGFFWSIVLRSTANRTSSTSSSLCKTLVAA